MISKNVARQFLTQSPPHPPQRPDRLVEGITGFIGRTERGPLSPHLVRSWDEFTCLFGSSHDNSTLLYLPFAVKGYFENGGGPASIVRIIGKHAKCAEVQLGNNLLVKAIGPGAWGNRIYIKIQAQPFGVLSLSDGPRFQVKIYYYHVTPTVPPSYPWEADQAGSNGFTTPDEVEEYDNLEVSGDSDRSLFRVINSTSRFVRLQKVDKQKNQDDVQELLVPLQGGNDGADLTEDSYLGDKTSKKKCPEGLAQFEQLEGITMVCAPEHVHEQFDNGMRKAITQGLLRFCERQKNCLAILSIEKNQDNVQEVTPPSSSRFGAVYYPWIRVDGLAKNQAVLMPPIGHVAGVMSRIDREHGLHAAPVNAMLRGIVEEGQSPLEFIITKKHQSILNHRGINVLRDFRMVGGGIRVWGIRTMNQDPNWQFIHIQKFGMFLEEEIRTRLVDSMEPSRFPLGIRERIRGVTRFLDTQWECGGLAGEHKREAYFIKLTRGTPSRDPHKKGSVVVQVGVALLEPSKFFLYQFPYPAPPTP